jgi:hypothetical protein
VLYDLLNSNKRFLGLFISFSILDSNNDSAQQQLTNDPGSTENSETALGSFLSLSSYLLQHNRTQRSAPYTHLCLIILLILVEDPSVYPYHDPNGTGFESCLFSVNSYRIYDTSSPLPAKTAGSPKSQASKSYGGRVI